MVYALFSIALLGCIVWAHHMFTVGMDYDIRYYYSLSTFIIALPTGIKIYTWLYNIYSNNIIFNPLIILIFYFIFLFLFGGLTGIILSNNLVDLFFHDSYYVVAHFHYVLSLGAVFGIFLAFFFLYNKILFLRNFYINYVYLTIFIMLLFLSVNLIFFPMHLLGLWGLPRRYSVFTNEFYSFSFFIFIGINLLLIIIICLLIYFFYFYIFSKMIYSFLYYVYNSICLFYFNLNYNFFFLEQNYNIYNLISYKLILLYNLSVYQYNYHLCLSNFYSLNNL